MEHVCNSRATIKFSEIFSSFLDCADWTAGLLDYTMLPEKQAKSSQNTPVLSGLHPSLHPKQIVVSKVETSPSRQADAARLPCNHAPVSFH